MKKIEKIFNKGVLKYIKSILISFLVFIILLSGFSFIFSNRLSKSEYEAVNSLYSGMRKVDSEMKSDLYNNFMIKVLDKEYVVEELRKDSLTYCILVNDKIVDMLIQNKNKKDINKYISNTYLPFHNFKDLSVAVELYDSFRSFGNYYIADEEYLDSFGIKVYEIIGPEQEELSQIQLMRRVRYGLYLLLYFLILCLTHLFVISKITKKNLIDIYNFCKTFLVCKYDTVCSKIKVIKRGKK